MATGGKTGELSGVMDVMGDAISYKVYIDWESDGYGGGDEITAHVMRVQIKSGMSGEELARVAKIGTASIRVSNADKRFSPNYASGAYYPNVRSNLPARVQVTDGVTTWTIFEGFTRAFEPEVGSYEQRTTTIQCVDRLALLQDFAVSLPLQEDKNAGYLLKMICAAAFRGGQATGRVDFAGNPENNDSVTIDGVVYTFKTALTPSANEVLIGADLYATADNLIAAVNGNFGSGTTYGTGTTRPATCSAEATASFFKLTRDANPLRWHRLGETSGTNADDRGKNGRDATYSGSTLGQAGALTGDPDGAVLHDGINDIVDLPIWDFYQRSFAVELWVKFSASPPASQTVLFGTRAGAGAGEYFAMTVASDGSGSFGIFGDEVAIAAGTFTFGGSTWYQLIYSFDYTGAVGKAYVNAVLIGSEASTGITNTITVLKVDERLKGYADEALIWDRALTDGEISARYAARTVNVGVTIKAKARGTWGNSITLAESSSSLSVTGATLTGGTDGTGTLDFETGRMTFDVAGDQWTAERTNGLDAVKDVIDSELGLFFQKRNGELAFRDRDYIFKRTSATAALTITNDLRDAQVQLDANQIFNRIVISFQPRGTLSAGIVARARNTISVPGVWGEDRNNPADDLPAGGVTVVTLSYVDPGTGETIGARDLTLPLAAGTDFEIWENADQTGFDYTNNGLIAFTVAATGSGIEVSLKNSALGTLYIFDLQVRGTGIVVYDTVQVAIDDADSQDVFGRRVLNLKLPLGGNEPLGRSIAQYFLARFKEARQRISSVRIDGKSAFGAVNLYSLEISDLIVLSDTQAAISAERYMLTGVDYTLTGGTNLRSSVTLWLRRLDDQTYWILQEATYGVLDTTSRLGI